MNVYVAASFARRPEAQALANRLELEGHTVTSRWLDDSKNGTGDYDAQLAESNKASPAAKMDFKVKAQWDLEDVTAADVLVVITGDKLTYGGRHSEVGIALAQKKYVYILGPREQVFHYHRDCINAIDAADLCAMLKRMDEVLKTYSPNPVYPGQVALVISRLQESVLAETDLWRFGMYRSNIEAFGAISLTHTHLATSFFQNKTDCQPDMVDMAKVTIWGLVSCPKK